MRPKIDHSYNADLSDFHQARQKAQLEELAAGLAGKSPHLLSYDDVREKLKAQAGSSRGLKEIPLKAIVGSVGRYTDFTRSFLPRNNKTQDRWAKINAITHQLTGLPPIEVYQIGEVYFVLDGNHRVSVARQVGTEYIEANVTEVHTRVPLTPDVTPDELIIKARYADFLERTHLGDARSEADLMTTTPGHYRTLEEQINAHQLSLTEIRDQEVSCAEAAADWYDHVYLPVIQIIRAQGILPKFPHRTETDLYVWLLEHRQALTEELGWDVPPEAAVSDLINQHGPLLTRMSDRLREAVTPDSLEAGPPPGQWRRELVELRPHPRLFGDLLVALDGEAGGWQALEAAPVIAQREGGHLHGLHLIAPEAHRDEEKEQTLRAEFQRRCQAAAVLGEMAVEVGQVAVKICVRARWADLVVVSLTHPPAAQLLARLGSGFRTLVRRCPRPILAVPTLPQVEPALPRLERALLAYDASPKAQEALFVATYLSGSWQIPLVVLTVNEKDKALPDILAQARAYLESRGVRAEFVTANGSVAQAILDTSTAHQNDLVIMGGYGSTPVVEVVLGSAVDQVLRQSPQPVLICR